MLPDNFGKIDWEMFEIDMDEVLINSGNGLNFELTGRAGLNISGVSGGLRMGGTDRGGLRILSSGEVDNFTNSLSGGDFSILDVISVSVENVGFSDSPTEIVVTANTSNGNNISTSDRSIRVNNYFSFGGSIDIAGFMSGGVDRMLSYNTDHGYALLIENANLEIEDVISMRMDLIYENTNRGYKILAGATGNLEMGGYEITVVGKIATGSFGFYIVAGGLQIPVGPVVITGVGGGFFYNPTRQDINLVKSISGLNNPTVEGKIEIPNDASFAVFLYGSLAFVNDAIIQGRVLLSMVGTSYFSIDGQLVFLSLENQLEGLVSLQADFDHGYIDGNIEIMMKVNHLLDGNGTLSFYIYGSDTWAVMGDAHAKIVNYFDVTSNLFIGPSGFLLGMSAEAGFDIWIIKVSAGFEAQIWYLENVSWGAYATAHVSASLWANIASAKGWLKCALFGEPNFYIYGEAGVKVSVLCFSGSATVWAKISKDGVDGGKGSDSEMRRLINEAKGVCEDAEEQAAAIQNAVNNQPPPSFSLSEEELAAAFATLSEWGRKFKYGTLAEHQEAWKFFSDLRGIETKMPSVPGYLGEAGEFDIYRLVINRIYEGMGAPYQTDFSEKLTSLDSALTAYSEVRSEFISNIDPNLTSIEAIVENTDSIQNTPVSVNGMREPEFTEYVDENGIVQKRIVRGTQPEFDVDEEISSGNSNILTEGMERAREYENNILSRIQTLDENIQKIEFILRGEAGRGGAETLAESYTNMIAKINEVYISKYVQDKKMYNWSNSYRDNLFRNRESIEQIMAVKANNIYTRSWGTLRELAAARAAQLAAMAGNNAQDAMSGVRTAWNNYHDQVDESTFRSWAITEAKELGVQLWYTLPHDGLYNLTMTSRNIANGDVNDKKEVVNSLRDFQNSFSNQINDLYTSLASLYEKKSDILNLLIYSRQNNNQSTWDLENQKLVITRKMVLPSISFMQATVADKGMYSLSQIRWNTSGNIGGNKYLVDYVETSPFNGRRGFGAVGAKRAFQIAYLPELDQTTFGPTTFYLKARNLAGYTIQRSIQFTPTFSNIDHEILGDIDIVTNERDLTPPLVASYLNFPENYISKRVEGSEDSRKYYIGTTNEIRAAWDGRDGESGIMEYLYKLVEVRNPDNDGNTGNSGIGNMNVDFSPSLIAGTNFFMPCGVENRVATVIDQTTNNGRSNVNLNTLSLSNNSAYKLVVSAVNGDGLNSLSCGGMKQYIIVDLTPPTKPAVISVYGGVQPRTLNSFTKINPVEELPAANGGYPFSRLIYNVQLDNSEAMYRVRWNESEDNQSGILRYEYKVTNKRNTNLTTDWLDAGIIRNAIRDIPKTEVQLTNDIPGLEILNYVDSFYVDIRAINYAQLPSENFRYTFQIADPTRPSNPDVAFAYSNGGTRPVLLFKTHSRDIEAGIDYYEVAAGSQPNGIFEYLTWENAIHINPENIRDNGSYTLYGFPENTRSYIAVRAVNKQGVKSRYCYTGPYYQDNTKPVTPSVALDKYSVNGQIILTMSFSNVRDLESEIEKVEYKILKQNAGDGAVWSIASNWTDSPSLVTNAVNLSRLNLTAGNNVKVMVRSVNCVHIASFTSSEILNLDTTPPVLPTVNLTCSGSLSKRALNINFENISDPESGIDHIEYRIYKERSPTYLGFRSVSDWHSIGTNTSNTVPYSLYNFDRGDLIKVRARSVNKNGVVSEIADAVIRLN